MRSARGLRTRKLNPHLISRKARSKMSFQLPKMSPQLAKLNFSAWPPSAPAPRAPLAATPSPHISHRGGSPPDAVLTIDHHDYWQALEQEFQCIIYSHRTPPQAPCARCGPAASRQRRRRVEKVFHFLIPMGVAAVTTDLYGLFSRVHGVVRKREGVREKSIARWW